MGSAAQPARADVPFSIRLALGVTGFSTVVSQIVLMRELLIASYGNELSLGIMLSLWLALTAIGSGILGRYLQTISARKCLSALLIMEATALFAAIWIIRNSRIYWHPTPGEVIGPAAVLCIAFLSLFVFCPISGALFAVGSRFYASSAQLSTGHAGSSMYLLEAIGSTAGGILVSIFLLRILGSLQISTFVMAANLIASICIVVSARKTRWALSILAIATAAISVFLAPRLERAAVAKSWPGFKLLATRTSPYGSLTVVETGGNRSIIQNGIVLFTAPDQAFAEEAVHFPLLEHPSPHSVLLIGGGLNGSIAEILKHPTVDTVDYVELDPAVVQLARDYFPNSWQDGNASRVHVHEVDGRLFVRSTSQRFDVIILNLPEPQTGQINRFYTEEFFRQVASHLSPRGVFGFQMRASEEYLSPQMVDFLRCLNATLRRVFPETGLIPGENVHFLAAQQPNILTLDPQVLLARLRNRGVRTQYVSEYYLPFRMDPGRLADLNEQLRPLANTRINRDFAPVAYYFDIELWATQFSGGYRTWFDWAAGISLRNLLGGIILLFMAALAAFIWCRDRVSTIHAVAGSSVVAMGFTVMTIEIVMLLGFQAVHGYVFQELAVITAGFMSGMAVGSWLSLRTAGGQKISVELRRLLFAQIAATVMMLSATPLTNWIGGSSATALPSFLLQAIFAFTALLSGMIAGYQFPVAMRMFTGGNIASLHAAGALYGLDLLGASLGAMLVSVYLLPLFGFRATAEVAAVANVGPVLLTLISFRSVTSSQDSLHGRRTRSQ